jgi:heme exporter protein B
VRTLAALIWKECLLAWRKPQRWLAETTVGVVLAMIIGMALDAPAHVPAAWAAGLMWVLLYFTCALGAYRSGWADEEWGAQMALLLSPIDRSMIFYAKWITAMALLIPSGAVQWMALWLYLNLGIPSRPWELIGVAGVGIIGLSGISVWVQSLTRGSHARELLAPFLFFPFGIPLLLGLIRMTGHALTGAGPFPLLWLELAAAYIVCGGILPWLLYDVWTEV